MKNLKIFVIAIFVAVTIALTMNSDNIKENLSWVFEADESQIALPELSNKEIEEAANKNKYGDFDKKRVSNRTKTPSVESEDLQEEEIEI